MEAVIEKVASGTFKKDFGRVLEDARHNPITITRHGRDFVTLISAKDFEMMKNAVLGEYFAEKVANGEMSFIDAIKQEQMIMRDVEGAEQEYGDGKYTTLDEIKKKFNLQ